MLKKSFGTIHQMCCLTQSCLGALLTIPSTSWLGFCSDMHCQLWRVPFQIMSNQFTLPQVYSNEVIETSQG